MQACVYGAKGWPECHCNVCIGKIKEWKGFKKGGKFDYKGIPVEIESFCPLPACKEIFIQGTEERGFCEWLTAEEATRYLRVVSS